MDSTEGHLYQCFARARTGDDHAYRHLLIGISSLVRRYARRRLNGHDADVEDLVQDVLLAVHLKQHTYDATKPVTAWVHTIARYKMVDFWRHQTRLAEDPLSPEDADAIPDESDHTTDTAADLDVLLATLPAAQRAAIQLVKLEGYRVEEAAAKLNLSTAAVKVYIHRGLKKLAAQRRNQE